MSEPRILTPAEVADLAERNRLNAQDTDVQALIATVRAAWAERDYWKRYAEDSDAQALEWRRQRDAARCWAKAWKRLARRRRNGFHAALDQIDDWIRLVHTLQDQRDSLKVEVARLTALVERHREDSKS